MLFLKLGIVWFLVESELICDLWLMIVKSLLVVLVVLEMVIFWGVSCVRVWVVIRMVKIILGLLEIVFFGVKDVCIYVIMMFGFWILLLVYIFMFC